MTDITETKSDRVTVKLAVLAARPTNTPLYITRANLMAHIRRELDGQWIKKDFPRNTYGLNDGAYAIKVLSIEPPTDDDFGTKIAPDTKLIIEGIAGINLIDDIAADEFDSKRDSETLTTEATKLAETYSQLIAKHPPSDRFDKRPVAISNALGVIQRRLEQIRNEMERRSTA